MKKTRKMLAWMLLAAMPMTGVAEGAAVERAAAPIDAEQLDYYPSYHLDEATGKWIVRSNLADALVDRFWSYDMNYGETLCTFHLEIEGDARTGIWTPVLKFHYNGSKTVNATAVSLLADGIRYDLAASSVAIENDGYKAQCVSAPLTEEALEAVWALIAGEEVSVRLIGDVIYTAELDTETTNSRRRIEAASMYALAEGVALLEEAGLESYELWDLSAQAWEREYGFRPAYARSEVVQSLRENKINDDFGMIIRNDQNKAAKAAQEVLMEYGFMSGSATNTFGPSSSAAARRAQEYLGMIVTGCMDVQLEQALAAGRQAKAEEAAGEMDTLGKEAEIALDRYWFAKGVSASEGTESLRTVFNGDNVFLAADGQIRNISPEELHLFMQVRAEVVYNGSYVYEATVVCECNDGKALDTLLLPMAQSRLLVYAEIPAQLAQDDQAQWSIRFVAGDSVLEYGLQ